MASPKLLVGAMAALVLSTGVVGDATAGRVDCDAAAESVRAQIASACPCNDAAKRNDHVRCVTDKLRALSECKRDGTGNKDCGPVPRQCLGKIRRTASRSTCGNPDLVTCCMPRQHDCRNDPHPGDGKAEGTCSKSSKPCDKLEDCVMPRCQPASSNDGCIAMGGTVGKSKDCATACAP